MTNETTSPAIKRTKLHRFPIPGDYVHRPRLLERLEQNRYKYKMEGFDEEWIETDSTRRFATNGITG